MLQRCNKFQKVEQQIGKNSAQWPKLPKECLSKIASLLELEGPSDKCRFQLVCKKWYYSCLPSSKHVLYVNLPLKLSIIPSFFIQDKGPIFIVGTCVFIVQPLKQPLTQPWLVFVEELNLGKLKVHCPLTKKPIEDLPLDFRKGVNLSGFRVMLVHEGLKMCFGNGGEDVVKVQEKENRWFGFAGRTKVILASNEGDLSHSACLAIVLAICEGGVMMSFNVRTGVWRGLDCSKIRRFDDVVCFRSFVYVIDRKGRLYPIDVNDNVAKVGNVIASGICEGLAGDTRKRLLVMDKELHMICRTRMKFEVYKLNERLGQWEEANSFGNRIVLVTPDEVFSINASDFPRCRGDCILFSKQCFPDYNGSCSFERNLYVGAEKYLEVGVYYMGKHYHSPISSYPELCDMLRPFPSWIYTNSSSTTSSSRKVEERQGISSRLTAPKSSREALDMPIALNAQTSRVNVTKRVSEIPNQISDNSAQAICHIPQIHESGNPTKTLHITRGEVPEKEVPEIIDVDAIPDDPPLNTNAVNVEKFEGVNVSSSFIPFLHKIRNKHGKIIQGNVDEVQSDSILLKCCLETVAKTVKILQSDSVSFLSDSDIKFLGACLSDLPFMRCNAVIVNWLVPFVKSALDHHHKNKEQICKLKELKSVRLKMLDLLHQLEEEEKKIADNLSVSPFLDIKNELC